MVLFYTTRRIIARDFSDFGDIRKEFSLSRTARLEKRLAL
jgi:hypothetical protein